MSVLWQLKCFGFLEPCYHVFICIFKECVTNGVSGTSARLTWSFLFFLFFHSVILLSLENLLETVFHLAQETGATVQEALGGGSDCKSSIILAPRFHVHPAHSWLILALFMLAGWLWGPIHPHWHSLNPLLSLALILVMV